MLHATQVRPIIHHDMIPLLRKFIKYKRTCGNGSSDCRNFYKNKTKTIVDLVNRLLTKRSAAFYGKNDTHILRDGRKYQRNAFSDNPSKRCRKEIEKYMCYQEMALASMLTVSAPVQIINGGSKCNMGTIDSSGKYFKEAIYVGQVGSRFERPGKMESHQFIAEATGSSIYCPATLCKAWATFYDGQYGRWSKPLAGTTFRHTEQMNRFEKQAEMLLAEAQYWGTKKKKDVRVYAVGLGTGVWAEGLKRSGVKHPGLKLNQMIIRSYTSVLSRAKGTSRYSKIKYIEFGYHPFYTALESDDLLARESRRLYDLGDHRRYFIYQGVKFVFHTQAYKGDGKTFYRNKDMERKNDKVRQLNDCLLVANFAWDSNSWPGNEYWTGNYANLKKSGDTAAACCSTIWNHLNPVLNKDYMKGSNTWVMGKNGRFKRLVDHYVDV